MAGRSPIRRAVDETTARLLEILDRVAQPHRDGSGARTGVPSDRLESISELADLLIERGDRVRLESERLREVLAASARELEASRAAGPRDDQASGPPSEEAVLHATKMAIAGARREKIADSLVEEFGVRDPDAVIESILGPSGRS